MEAYPNTSKSKEQHASVKADSLTLTSSRTHHQHVDGKGKIDGKGERESRSCDGRRESRSSDGRRESKGEQTNKQRRKEGRGRKERGRTG